MTNQEINERVAKLCGWVSIKPDDESNEQYWANTCQMAYSDKLPLYTQSLDACREFEDFSTGEEWAVYINTLTEVCDMYNDPIVATPLQRCEAFLRLKGQLE